MKKIFLTLSIILLIYSNANAEIIALVCKFQNGVISSDGFGAQALKSGDYGTDDVIIKLDSVKRTLIEAPFLRRDYINGSVRENDIWSENEIEWDSEKTPYALGYWKYILNRFNSTLKATSEIKENHISTIFNYSCFKTSKQF
jgi:hypothetical protein